MAKRFDRHIASPQTLALPQNYDEFLQQEELPCLIEGCTWRGQNLGNHLNFSHGIVAREGKRAGGFNLKTGLVCQPLHEKLCETNSGKGASPEEMQAMRGVSAQAVSRSYRSKEGVEHSAKSRLLTESECCPIRNCRFCHEVFRQSTPFGKALYCSIECRDADYREKSRSRKYPLSCAVCAASFYGNRGQFLRSTRGAPVCCSLQCKGVLNGSRPKPARRSSDQPNDGPSARKGE